MTAATLPGVRPSFYQYVVTCSCGMIPLGDAAHDTARACWETAAKHVELNARCASTVRTSHELVIL